MNSKILVTGGTGNIGSVLVQNLKNAKADFKVMVRQEEAEKTASFKNQGVETVTGNFSNIDSLFAAMRGIDKVYLLPPSAPDMDKLTINVIDAAKKAGVKHIVKQSVLGADVNAFVDIPKLHAVGDEYLKKSGIAYAIIQPNAFFQNFLGSAGSIKSQGAFYANYGDGKFSAIDVRDIAAVTATVLTKSGHENKIYPITGPAAISASDVAKALSTALGKEIKYVAVPSDATKAAMIQMGYPEWLAENLKGFGEIFAQGWAGTVTNNVETLTGKKAINIDQFAKDFASYFS